MKNKKLLNSKKHVLKKLKEGWDSELFDLQSEATLEETGKNDKKPKIAVAITISTGLRPAELQKGVVLRLINNLVEIEISGAKIDKDEFGKIQRGIEKRWLTLNPEYNSASEFLTSQMKRLYTDSKINEVHYEYCSSTLAKTIRTLGKKYLEKCQNKQKFLSISPYCFRHLISASIKSCDTLDDIERAQILGHLSVDSMQSYAKGFRSKSSIKPILSVRTSEIPVIGKLPVEKKFSKTTRNSTHKSPSPQPRFQFTYPGL